MKKLTDLPYVLGYAIYTPEAIPVKYQSIEYKQVVQYGALISDLLFRARINIRKMDLQTQDTELQNIRIRTKRDTELIISQINDYFMLVIQQCEGQFSHDQEEEKEEEGKEA
uniref:Roadblock/LAMTOR2 domain-containing protein n=2 Tax=Fabrea salina TaxID=342563 RepID=A0A7S3IAM3_9CILI|mmetsp:Transcript_780/g.1233  ORF Transcript_780/g.1233 Transcript_780/m.1233 type:complete len:112 (+) Transcript_780:67-402(+)|eukprot:CAMPEP_0202440110 /NCGR_PEP_ID=MMETSP1345-20130828/36520_1 /ASSEMBLY_ACC=CAM_ASM_000843 /TAXON_ID=342563 /ORGANISM="Fabrea Fabrea salina" /LENGTH=111 /DNA_ID=CAMNT_0049054683 /DNA_START=584 /DNA_END=919 /DNA_ORIENTATION=-